MSTSEAFHFHQNESGDRKIKLETIHSLKKHMEIELLPSRHRVQGKILMKMRNRNTKLRKVKINRKWCQCRCLISYNKIFKIGLVSLKLNLVIKGNLSPDNYHRCNLKSHNLIDHSRPSKILSCNQGFKQKIAKEVELNFHQNKLKIMVRSKERSMNNMKSSMLTMELQLNNHLRWSPSQLLQEMVNSQALTKWSQEASSYLMLI